MLVPCQVQLGGNTTTKRYCLAYRVARHNPWLKASIGAATYPHPTNPGCGLVVVKLLGPILQTCHHQLYSRALSPFASFSVRCRVLHAATPCHNISGTTLGIRELRWRIYSVT